MQSSISSSSWHLLGFKIAIHMLSIKLGRKIIENEPLTDLNLFPDLRQCVVVACLPRRGAPY